MGNLDREPEKKTPARTKYPADKKKGELERGNRERLGHARDTESREPTGNGEQHGGSDVGVDESSGSEVLEQDPTRFPVKE